MEKEVEKIINQFPGELPVSIRCSEEGGFYAEVRIVEEVITTQGETLSELIEMINDAVYTYFEVPRKYLSVMPAYVPPVETAQDLKLYLVSWSPTPIAHTNN